MYLAEIVEDTVTKKLQQLCVNKTVKFIDRYGDQQVIFCTSVKCLSYDGNYWIDFIDDHNNKFSIEENWFEIVS